MKTYTLDATGKRVGRLATEIAVLLMGKNSPDFAKNKIPDIQVVVNDASKLNIDTKKMEEKTYARHSGYPGGLTLSTMKQVIAKKGAKEVLRTAVSGMLPKNKLRARMLANLKIND